MSPCEVAETKLRESTIIDDGLLIDTLDDRDARELLENKFREFCSELDVSLRRVRRDSICKVYSSRSSVLLSGFVVSSITSCPSATPPPSVSRLRGSVL